MKTGSRPAYTGTLWQLSHRADPRSVALADRHYSRQKPGTPQFVPPGRCMVLYAKTASGEAVWVTSWPFAQYVKHAWAGAWTCSIFRNEGAALSSELIRQAVACTRAFFGDPPALGIITFVLPRAIRSINPGACFKHAGWQTCGAAKDGKPCLQLLPDAMPPAAAPLGYVEQPDLLGAA